MKLQKNIPVLFALVFLLFCFAATAMAAVPGETAVWGRSFTVPKISGNLIITDTSCLESYSVSPGEGPFSFDSGSDQPATWSFSVTGVVQAEATEGTYTIGYMDVNQMDAEGNSLGYVYVPIVIRVDPAPTPTPKPYTATLNYVALRGQIQACEALKESDYAEGEWEKLQEALTNAKGVLMQPKDQASLDAAAEALRSAIEAAVPLDRSALQDALTEADELLEQDDFGRLYARLIELLPQGRKALELRDQAEIDASAGALQALLDEVRQLQQDYTVTVVQEKEIVREKIVEAEAPPIPEEPLIHKLWPWFFGVSAAANIALIVVLARKKKKRTEIPIAQYDMDDDLWPHDAV